MTRLAAFLLLWALVGARSLAAQPLAAGEGCGLCHGELELLRQHVPTLEEARALVASHATLEGSAHAGMACRQCHSGFDRYPHNGGGRTEGCASCHEEVRESWAGSVHANPDRTGADRIECVACHGIHDVLPAEAAHRAPGLLRMNASCVACHETRRLPDDDPHADTVPCVSCHEPHATRDVDDPLSVVAPASQVSTCGSCHADQAEAFGGDVHGMALARIGTVGAAELALSDPAPPSCTACHGGHGMAGPDHARFSQEMVEECGSCHAEKADSYFGTYHGKATALGSEIVATCDQCHGAHEIYPEADVRSSVNPARLVETCGVCHEHARPAFVKYDSHPDPADRERDPPLYFSFVFMNTLLVGVVLVFGLHTALWWVRLTLDRRKGGAHGIGIHDE